MDFRSVNARALRLVEALPVLAALGMNAVAHGRWVLSGPVALALVGCVLLGVHVEHRPGRLLLAGAAGLAVGVAFFFAAPPPPGPIPPAMLSPMCGGLVAVAAFCVLSGSNAYALVYALLLAVLSANAAGSSAVLISAGVLFTALAVSLLVRGAVWKTQATGLVAFLGFLVLVVPTGLLLTRFVLASEGWLMETVAQLTSGGGVRSLEAQSVDLPARITAPMSTDPLFELDGEPPRYLRTAVLEVFDGRRWSESFDTRAQKLALPGGAGTPLGITFIAPTGRTIPAPAGVLSVDDAKAEARGGWVIQSDDLVGRRVGLVHGEERLPEEAAPAESETALPEELHDQLWPLAAQLLAGKTGARAEAEALEHFFTQAFEYSLTVDLKGQGHPLAVLVRERRPAFCSYFASAMVALLRSHGVAARLVTGFAPAEKNRLTGRTLIRSRDAHAWVEVYVPEEKRWVQFDPTPWNSRDAALDVARSKPWLLDAWEALASVARRAWAAVRYTPGAAVLAVLTSPFTWGLVLVAFALTFGRRRWKQRAKKQVATEAFAVPAQLRETYSGYLKLLARAGLERAPQETDDELLLRLKGAASAEAAVAAERFIHAFRRERFRAPESARLDDALRALETALRASPQMERMS